MWSDPDDIEIWTKSKRGCGWMFGEKILNEFNHLNDLELLCRAH